MADATIILAGGIGARLWPESLKQRPKQLLKIGDESLIQQSVRRAAAATPVGPIVIVTHRDHVDALSADVLQWCRNLRDETSNPIERLVYLAEPAGRNTAPAIAFGMRYLASILPDDATVLVLTSDHRIGPVPTFAADASIADDLARQGHLVTFGIKPTRPETGYGYIEAGEPIIVDHSKGSAYHAAAFREKPDLATAESYLALGTYFWNSGMFCFSIAEFWSQMAAASPEVAGSFRKQPPPRLQTGADGSKRSDADALATFYRTLPKISIDHALMEKSRQVAMVTARFDWSDVGSWDEIARLNDAAAEAPGDGRPEHAAPVVEIAASDNFIRSDLPVAICGVSGIHVVVKNGMILVCRKGNGQQVRQVVETMEKSGRPDLV